MGTDDMQAAIAYLNAHGADVRYVSGFFSPEEADGILARLRTQVALDAPEQSRIRRPYSSEWIDVPRQQVAHGEPGARYDFSGTSVRARPWTPLLLELRERLSELECAQPNFVLINRYRDGADSMGWHADDERDLGPEPEILSMTFGAERDFQFRHKQAFRRGGRPGARADLATVTLRLAHGSLLWMRHPTNRDWKHQLPRRGGRQPERIGERWNLTWRVVAPRPEPPMR